MTAPRDGLSEERLLRWADIKPGEPTPYPEDGSGLWAEDIRAVVRALREERDRPHRCQKALGRANVRRKKAEAERDAAREALRKYGRHQERCRWGDAIVVGEEPQPCTCGLRTALGEKP